MLIYINNEANIMDTVEYTSCLMKIDKQQISKNYADLKCGSHEIRIRRFNESSRGNKDRIILHDTTFNKEQINNMGYGLIDARCIKYGENRRSEILLAPIGILKWLSRNDFIYIVGMKEVELVTKDLIKALTYLNENSGTISCYKEDDTSNLGELWWGEVWRYNKHEAIDYSIERLIIDISNYDIK